MFSRHVDEAALNAQHVGKNPSLCAPDSGFQQSFRACEKCLNQFRNDCSVSVPDDLVPSMQKYVDYCNDATGSGNDLEANAQKIQLLVKSNACLSSSLADLQSSLSHSSTEAPPAATSARPSSSPPATPPDRSPEQPPGNIARTIVPAVVAPVAVVCIAFAILAYFLWRWRQRLRAKEAKVLEEIAEPSEFGGKAELPADKSRSELDGIATDAGNEGCKELDTNEVAELPAREVVAAEMDANEQHR